MVDLMAQQHAARTLSIKGPDGQVMTREDLPPPGIRRWVTRRKAQVVAAVRGGLLSKNEACERYALSEEELAGWSRLYDEFGTKGLRTTSLQQYRAN